MPESFLDDRVLLYAGGCLEVLKSLADNSIDSCVTDPPYHLTSIVKRFGADNAAPAKVGKTGAYARLSVGFMGKQWDGGDIAFRPELWAEVLRVLKPGAYIVAFSSTRTFGRMSCAIEDAGFIVHPFIAWLFGQGFPKAHRITHSGLSDLDRATEGWNGWRYGGQVLKPAIEPIFMGQKPFAPGLTGSQNVQRYGAGALNIDGCRIETNESTLRPMGELTSKGLPGGGFGASENGRWPANVIHDGSDEVVGMLPVVNPSRVGKPRNAGAGDGWGMTQTGAEYADAGSAARFFYTAKADADDRLGSKHPTVKPLDLMQWLARLTTPPGGTILDPFAGTGTTGEAAWREKMAAILIEREAEYQDDIRRRMSLCKSSLRERNREALKIKTGESRVGPLFGDEPMEVDDGHDETK